MDDEVFKKIESKTKINKETIINLAKMINDNGLKDEKTIKKVINELSKMTNKPVSNDLENKIIETIKDNKVPKNVEKFF